MRAARTDDSRIIVYHSPNLRFDGREALRRQILRFIRGIRGPRQGPVRERQILEWFQNTNESFTKSVIDEMLANGDLVISKPGSTIYALPETAG